MEVPASQDGIQRLLAAEQEAQAIVQKARKGAAGCMLLHQDAAIGARAAETSAVTAAPPPPAVRPAAA